MATQVNRAGAAIVAVIVVGAAIGGLITRDDDPASTAPTTTLDTVTESGSDGGTDTSTGAGGAAGTPTTLLPGAAMHSELGWTMQISRDWVSAESAEGVAWSFGDQAQVEVITTTTTGTLDDHGTTVADELETSFDDVINARAEATSLDDGTPAQRITAQADAGGTPVGIVIYIVEGGGQFIAAAYVAEQSEFDATASAVENHLRTLRPDS